MVRRVSLVVAVLALSAQRIYRKFFPNEACAGDPPIVLGLHDDGRPLQRWDTCDVFSLEYDKARRRFREAALAAGAKPYSIVVVEDDDGSTDSALTTDVAVLEGKLPGVLVHSSATHGIEGYAGSAIQRALLSETVLPPPEDRPTIVLVHAVNPHGMKHYRRFNEHNVDLNRNAIADFPGFLEQRDPNVAGYEDFRDLVAPRKRPGPWDLSLGFFVRALPALVAHGFLAIKRVLVAGQYHHPTGMFFGGRELQPSLVGLEGFLERSGILEQKGPLVWIDVHTGLGAFGKDTLLSDSGGDLSEEDLREAFPSAHHFVAPASQDKKAMSGYELTRGTLTSFLAEEAIPGALCLTQEFGTLPGLLVGRALILENALHHHGGTGADRELGRKLLGQAFYPQSGAWRASIVQRGVSLVFHSLRYLQNQSQQQIQQPPQR